MTKPFTAAELAGRLGHSRDWLYRNLDRLVREGMPAPISPVGQYRWERTGMNAWLNRHHPLMRPAANDAEPLPVPASEKQWGRALAREYGVE
jgi:hypothetical protein